MYQQIVKTKEQAILHLFFHCCYKDGDFGEEELKMVSDIIVSIGLDKVLNLKEEIQTYKAYKGSIKDESLFLSFIIKTISPMQKLALFSFCAELFLSDKNVTLSEEVLINKIASMLYIKPSDSKTIQDLVCQLHAVQRTKVF
jgi:uncharacterized tellurite resistance protein B-like protein